MHSCRMKKIGMPGFFSHKIRVSEFGSESRVIYPGLPRTWDPLYGKRDPYHSHIFRDSYGNGMGIAFSDLGKLGKEASVLQCSSRAKKIIWGAIF